MDSTDLFVSFFFGLIGTGMLMYGKKAGKPVPMLAGLGLMLVPYFIPNLLVLSIVCAVMMASPWFVVID